MDKHDKYEVVKQAWFENNEHLRNNKQDTLSISNFPQKCISSRIQTLC